MSSNVFDKSMLMCWKDVDAKHWKTITSEIVNLFFEVSSDQEKILKESWKNRNIFAVAKSAHILKSSCGNVGANLAFSILNRIEKSAEENKIEEIEKLMAKIDPVLSESRAAVSEFLNQIQAA